jgi:hypothetical protein
MANYEKNAANALKSIAKAGKKFQIFRPVVTFNDVTGIPTDAPTLAGEITAVVLPRYKGQIFNSLDDSFKEALIRGKLRTVLAAAKGAPFSPEALDIVVINGTNWQVVGCTPLAPDGATPIIYTMGVIQCGSFTPTPTPP